MINYFIYFICKCFVSIYVCVHHHNHALLLRHALFYSLLVESFWLFSFWGEFYCVFMLLICFEGIIGSVLIVSVLRCASHSSDLLQTHSVAKDDLELLILLLHLPSAEIIPLLPSSVQHRLSHIIYSIFPVLTFHTDCSPNKNFWRISVSILWFDYIGSHGKFFTICLFIICTC